MTIKRVSSNPSETVAVVIMPNPLDHHIGLYKSSRLKEWADMIVATFGNDMDVYLSAHPRLANTDGNTASPTLAAAMEDGDDVLVVVAGCYVVDVDEKEER